MRKKYIGKIVGASSARMEKMPQLGLNFFQYIYIKKNWRAAGLEPTTPAPSRTIVTDGNC